RRRALELFTAKREPAFRTTLVSLLNDRELRGDAIRALAVYDTPDIANRLLSLYPSLNADERQDAIQTLTARPTFALSLLDAIEQGRIPRHEVSALVIRELQALNVAAVTDRLKKVWGDIRPAS